MHIAILTTAAAAGWGAHAATVEVAQRWVAVTLVAWSALAVLIAVHEGGHALVAWATGHEVASVEIGVGPTLAHLSRGGARVHLRAFPIVGAIVYHAAPDHTLRARVKESAVAIAGPLSSLVLAALAFIAAGSAAGGRLPAASLTGSEAALRATFEAATLPLVPLRAVLVSGSPARTHGRPSNTHARDGNISQPTTVVGLARRAPHEINRFGFPWVLGLFGALSAAIAGFNLIPAWGLDGHAVLAALTAEAPTRRSPIRRHALRCISAVGALLWVPILATFLAALLRDLAA